MPSYVGISDCELLANWDTDPPGFDELVRRHHAKVAHLVRNFIWDSDDAKDVCQQVWIKLIHNARNCKPEKSFTAWLTRIAVNTAVDELRKRRTHDEHVVADNEADAVVHAQESDFWIQEHVRSCLDALPADVRVCVVMYYIEDFTFQEIADALDYGSVATPKRKHDKGLQQLKACLEGKLNRPVVLSTAERGNSAGTG